MGREPEALKRKPDLPDYLIFVWNAYVSLQYSRNMNGQIPVSEIKAYVELMGIRDKDTIDDLLYFIRQMDEAYTGKDG